MRFSKEYIYIIFITIWLSVSIAFLNASKYDTADRIWLSLLTGLAILAIPFLIDKKVFIFNPAASLMLGGFAALVWVSYSFSQTKNFGFSEAVIYTFVMLVSLSIPSLTEKSKKILLSVILIITIASSLYGFWYFPFHGETRLAGLFKNFQNYRNFFPNAFANIILLAWPLSFLIIKKNWLKIITLSILSASLYLTFSRGAWIVFALQLTGFFIYALSTRQSQDFRKIIKISTASIILTILITTGLLNLRLQNFKNVSLAEKIIFKNSEFSTSFKERIDFWLGAARLSLDRPLTGHGPMSFRYVYPPLQKIQLAISDHPHNWWLKISSENGIPAVILFTAFLILLLYIVIKKSSHEPRIFILGIALFGGFLHNMIDYNLNFLTIILAFFIIAGTILGEYKLPEKNRKFQNAAAVILWLILIIMVPILSFVAGSSKNFISRDFFRDTGMLDIHLSQNPMDAYAWYLKGEPVKAIELDPLNRFAYYRAAMEKNILPVEYNEKLKKLLRDYDVLLKNNIHYTAFTDNPIEAAKIYELLGEQTKADEIRSLSEDVRTKFLRNP